MANREKQKSVPKVELHNSAKGSIARRKHSIIVMGVIGFFLISSTVSAHRNYVSAMYSWKQAEAQESIQKKPKRHSAMSQNTRALQQQVQQMKALMERQQNLQKLEMEVLRHELGTYKPKKVLKKEEPHQTSNNVGQDVDFARDIAKEAVQQEVQDFLEKVDLISKVGSYVAKRISD